jgi:hypothetical protein
MKTGKLTCVPATAGCFLWYRRVDETAAVWENLAGGEPPMRCFCDVNRRYTSSRCLFAKNEGG